MPDRLGIVTATVTATMAAAMTQPQTASYSPTSDPGIRYT
jgi:hypothetical protein